MKLKALTLIVLAFAVCAGTAACAEEAATGGSKLTLKPGCPAWTVREYKVDVGVTGKVPVRDIGKVMGVDSEFSLAVRHNYTRREDDGLMPLEISVLKGEAVVRDREQDVEQKMAIAPGSYPKLTALLDRNCQVTDIFGIAGSRYSESLPGLNYGNMIILFIPDLGGKPRAVGEKWQTEITVPSYGQTYKFTNTLKSVDPLARTAVIAQDISWKAAGDSAVQAQAESTFSIDDGKLLRSQAKCQVEQKVTPPGKDSAESQQEASTARANICVDIELIK